MTKHLKKKHFLEGAHAPGASNHGFGTEFEYMLYKRTKFKLRSK